MFFQKYNYLRLLHMDIHISIIMFSASKIVICVIIVIYSVVCSACFIIYPLIR